jgi:hypothetical protein
VGHQQVLNVTVTTYVDQLHVTFMSQREAIPDVGSLAGFVVEAVDLLDAEVAPARRSHRPRAKSGVKGRRDAKSSARHSKKIEAP